MRTEGRLRWVIFTTSVVSAVDNPDAFFWRALGTRLRRIGHEAIFFEPRGNHALRALLHRSGSRALKVFQAEHPDIEYRTLEPRKGADLVVWMTRTLATADVAIIHANAAPELISWLGKLTRPHLQTFYLDSGWNEPRPADDYPPGRLSEFTAIVLGDDRDVEKYIQASPGSPILSFGPLPAIQPSDDCAAPNAAELAEACQRLIDIVTATREEAMTTGRAQIGPNGHRL